MIKKKALRLIIEGVLSVFSLCSYTYADTNNPLGHYSSANNGETRNVVNGWVVGTTKEIDLGRRNWPIGQHLDITLNQCDRYDASQKRGFVYDYDPIFINPKALTSYGLSFSTSVSTTYTYSYSETMLAELSDSFNVELGIDFIKAGTGKASKVSLSETQSFSYSFGSTKEMDKEYSVDLDVIPDGYVFTLCYICSATIVDFGMTVYNNYWWGQIPSDLEEENFKSRKELIVDFSSMYLTIGIKKEGASGGPEYYLNA